MMLHNAVTSLSRPQAEVTAAFETEAIHLALRKQPGRLLLHLVNYSGSQTRPIAAVIPVKDVRVNLRLPEEAGTAGAVREVKSLKSGTNLPFTVAEGQLTVTLGELREYEVVVVEFQTEE